MKIPSNSPIDVLLDGGIKTGIVTHVYGPAGCGKTTFALQLSISAALRGYDVIYYDTEEAFPATRFCQMLGDVKDTRIMQRITVSQPISFDEQHNHFLRLGAKGGKSWGLQDLRVAIVDTITKHYRTEYTSKPHVKVFRELAEQQLPALLKAARKFDIAVLLLNQVSSDISSARILKPVGGDAVSRASKYEVKLEKEGDSNIGCATLTKTPSPMQTGKKAGYAITGSGISQPTPQTQPD